MSCRHDTIVVCTRSAFGGAQATINMCLRTAYHESAAPTLSNTDNVIYQDVCYPVTKEFREKLYNEIISEYEKAKEKNNEKAREDAKKQAESPDRDRKETPFR